MNTKPVKRNSSRRLVLLAVGLLVVLGGSLALRMVNRSAFFESRAEEPVTPEPLRWTAGEPRPGTVPAPRAVAAGDLEFPDWSRTNYHPPIRFQTDLDLIAPLGDGPENAAWWFADFARPAGAREAEYGEAVQRAAKANPDWPSPLLLPDDPLLLEAEPWVDQAKMQFYPDVWEPDGWETQLPNLLMALTLAKSWAARADGTEDLDAALDDYRRSIRFGRLLRQEDAVLITDLIGLACIKIGLEGMYDRLIETGETEAALVVSLALGEHAPQRLKTSEIFTSIEPSRYMSRGWFKIDVRMPDEIFRDLIGMANNNPDRRFRLEAILALNIVRFEGTAKQRREAVEVLERLAAAEDRWIADLASFALETPPDLEHWGDLH